MNKAVRSLVIIIILIGIALVINFLFDVSGNKGAWLCENGQWVKSGEPNYPMPESNCVLDETPLFFNDGLSGLEIAYPYSWEDVIKIDYKESEDHRTISFLYPYEGHDYLVMGINIFPGDMNLLSIHSLPNNAIILLNKENIITFTRSLDMPFMPGEEAHDVYVKLIEEVEDIVSALRFQNGEYIYNKRSIDSNSAAMWSVVLDYPEFTDGNLVDLNEIILDKINSYVDGFKESVSAWNADGFTAEHNSSINISYNILNWGDEFISMKFVVSEYMAGSAHPNNYTFSLSYALESKQLIDLDDVFSVGRDEYLPRLSELARQDLEDQFLAREMSADTETFLSGTDPKYNNFKNFNITDSDIIITFDPYSVASYAAGGFEVKISQDELSDILK